MNDIYMCPKCLRKYTITMDGDYCCECGHEFHFPPLLANNLARYTSAQTIYVNCHSRSVRKHTRFHTRTHNHHKHYTGGRDCPFAKASFTCAILGLIFGGILSLPAIILGLIAAIVIADSGNNYKGLGLTGAGIAIGSLGIMLWSYLLYSLL